MFEAWFLCLRELWQNMKVYLKCEITLGSDWKAKKWVCLAAGAIRKILKNLLQKMCFFLKPNTTCVFFTDVLFVNLFACWLGVSLVFHKHLKQIVFATPGPPGTSAPRVSNRTFFGGRFTERSVFGNENIKNYIIFHQRNRITCEKLPTMMYFDRGPKHCF